MTEREGVNLSPLLAEVRDSTQAHKLLLALTRNGTPLVTDGSSFRLDNLDKDADTADLLPLHGDAPAADGEHRFRCLVHGAAFEIGGRLRTYGERRVLEQPRLYSANLRSAPRIAVTGASTVDFGGPAPGRLLDVSASGLSFETDDLELCDGSDLSMNFEIGGRTFAGRGEVRRRQLSKHGLRVGATFDPDGDVMPLVDALIDERFPRLRQRALVRGHQIEQLFDLSGYAALRAGASLDDRWASLDARSQSVDRAFLATDGTPIGHISMTRAFSSTWVAHQLATLRDHPESSRCWQAIYSLSTMVPVMGDGDDAKLLCYFDRSLRWHQRFHDAFVAWHGDPDDAVITDLDRFEVTTTKDALGALRPRIADDDELGEVAASAARRFSRLTASALDLTKDRLRSKALHRAYVDSGLERSREVLTLRHDGRLLGAVLLERGSAALSLFGLFDMAHVFVEEGPMRVAATRALVDATIAWYRARGVERPIIVSPANEIAQATDALRLEETMGLMTWSARGLRHYENFVSYTFGRSIRTKRERAA